MGVICLFLWGIFAFLSPDTPAEIVEEVEVEETIEAEPDYQAQLAFRDQFHSLEKKPQAQPEPETNKLPTTAQPASLPSTQPAVQSVPPRSIPQPAAPRPVPRPTYRPAAQPVARSIPYAERYPLGQVVKVTEPEVPPQEQWLALANFGTGVSSRSIPQPRSQAQRSNTRLTPVSKTNSTSAPALLVNNPISQGELGILNRRRTNTKVVPSAPMIAISRGITKGKIELPLVWDSSLTPEQQQSNQITVILEEPIYDTEGKAIFESRFCCHS